MTIIGTAKADSRVRIKCALLGQTCHMFLLYLQPQKNRPFWCFRNIILCSVRHPTHVCTLGALECADRAIAEFMLSTPGTKRQSSLAPIGTSNKHIIVSGGGWTRQEKGCGTHTACKIDWSREGRVELGRYRIPMFHFKLSQFHSSPSLSNFLLHTDPQLFDETRCRTSQLVFKPNCSQISW